MSQLNLMALRRAEPVMERASMYGVHAVRQSGATVVDFGVQVRGGLAAGVALSEIAMAGLGRVSIVPCPDGNGPAVQVTTDQPLLATMAAQYAGWPLAVDGYFAMASGPMRSCRGREKVLQQYELQFAEPIAVGVLESDKLPDETVARSVAEECRVRSDGVTLCVAPTHSHAGSIQVVARSVEATMHKLFELGFDLRKVLSGWGVTGLPPLGKDSLTAIGWTNDAILYGSQVTLWIDASNTELETVGPAVPSSASPESGKPFARIFEDCQRDFYKIDPMLFGPASVTLVSIQTGVQFRFGQTRPDILAQSYLSP